MARPAGFEPVAHGLETPERHFKSTNYRAISAFTRPTTSKYVKPCKPLRGLMCLSFVPLFYTKNTAIEDKPHAIIANMHLKAWHLNR